MATQIYRLSLIKLFNKPTIEIRLIKSTFDSPQPSHRANMIQPSPKTFVIARRRVKEPGLKIDHLNSYLRGIVWTPNRELTY